MAMVSRGRSFSPAVCERRSRPRSRSMAVPRRKARTSATVAATLSFFLPGAGQAYARRWRPAVIFGLPMLVVVLLVGAELSQGISRLAARLLDPSVAISVMVAAVVLGVWRALAVVHAWQIARRTPFRSRVVPLLLTLIVATHGYAFVSASAMLDAGDRIASGGDSLLEPVAASPSPRAPLFAGSSASSPRSTAPPSGATVEPSASGNPEADEDPYNDEEGYEEEEPTIIGGPPAEYDIEAIATHSDGLLNVMIAGIDWMPGRTSRRTDTLIVVSVDIQSGDVYMFSFPRDLADFPLYTGGTYSGKINSFAGFASKKPQKFPDGGMKSLAHQLGYLLGIPIDYYAAVDIPGFEKVVDAIGGVTVYNEQAINDHYIHGGRGFFLPVGEHRLNAAQTLDYVRSRKGSSDFARARRQQQVLAALRREMIRPDKLASLPSIVNSIGQVLRTDFPSDRLGELIALSEKVKDDPTGKYVFRQPDWAMFYPRSEERRRSLTTLRIDKLRELSLELFGEKSLYNR